MEFEVDQNVSGDRWQVRIRHDGDVAFRGTRTTRGASGSFSVRIVENDQAGSDVFRARARNLSTDEVCVGERDVLGEGASRSPASDRRAPSPVQRRHRPPIR